MRKNKINFSVLMTLIVLTMLSIYACKSVVLIDKIENQKGIFLYQAGEKFNNKQLNIHYYISKNANKDSRVQIVLHGASRNAWDYLDSWITKAEEYDLIVIAPEFNKEQFNIDEYVLANMDTKKDIFSDHYFSIIDSIFLKSKERFGIKSSTYNLFGHSAGGQFVHRFNQFYNTPYVNKSVSANSGWYTMPSKDTEFPYGIGTLSLDEKKFHANFFEKDMTILLGTADTLRTPNLNQTIEADRQGLTRLSRGEQFMKECRSIAEMSDLKLNFTMLYVPDAGHDHLKMSPAAADVLYKK